MSYERAVKAINTRHMLLVYPVKNRQEPPSLWSVLHPRSEMRWDWSEDADPRVVRMWHLKNQLAEGTDVVYAKWYQDRATFFSRAIFPAVLRLLGTPTADRVHASRHAESLYEQLLDNSPQTPSMLREATGLAGRASRAPFERAMKVLWRKLYIVGTGEVDEGNFPALAAGATRHIFEDLWDEAAAMSKIDAEQLLHALLPVESPFVRFLHRQQQPAGLRTVRTEERNAAQSRRSRADL